MTSKYQVVNIKKRIINKKISIIINFLKKNPPYLPSQNNIKKNKDWL